MLSDKELKKKYEEVFRKSPEKYYPTRTLEELGYFRGKCKHCGRFFWSTDKYRDFCGDAMCSGGFSFIGNTPAKNKMNYIDVWKKLSKILGGFGYTPIKRYPVVARWRDDVHFVQASIDDFIPYVINGEVDPPENPLLVPQICLRFNDIDNVGITGQHYTAFIMVGQHRFEKPENYMQGEYLKHLFEWFSKGLGIRNNDLVFHEDVWAGSGNFGPCIEFFSGGLELANQVYMQFKQTQSGHKDLNLKVLDMGLGYERNAWFSVGESTSYEITFPTVMKTLKKITGIEYDKKLFAKFLPFSGMLNIDEVSDIEAVWKDVASKIGIHVEDLKSSILPLSALYSVAEHARSLLIALNDGALPSNVGGGYNLRVLLRRSLSFIDRYNWNINLPDICKWHADHLKPIFPELKENLDDVTQILDVEKEKFSNTKKKSIAIISKMVKEKVTEEDLLKVYDSKGIPPELIKEEAEKEGKDIDIPKDFYSKVSELHQEKELEKKEKQEIDSKGIEETDILYYQNPDQNIFDAKVLKISGDMVILDKTAFYPEGGGQETDYGKINNCKVYDVQKQGNVIIHFVEKPNFKEGETIRGEINWERRMSLTRHHTAIHIINLAARNVLGNHIFQAGSHKSEDKAHLDITHFKSLTNEEIQKIEEFANQIVKKEIEIKSKVMSRNLAEKEYGMRIYQGGAVPGKNIRIVSIEGFDTEACGGTHLSNTKKAGRIIILNSERIQDGIDRITIKAGEKADRYLKEILKDSMDVVKTLNELSVAKISDNLLRKLENPAQSFREFQEASEIFNITPEQLASTIKRFLNEIAENKKKVEDLGAEIPSVRKREEEETTIKDSLKDISKEIFDIWKAQRKEIEKLTAYLARVEAKKLIVKAKENMLFEVVHLEREGMISLANEIIGLNKNITVILANENGDIIGMSKKDEMGSMISNICKQAGGSGGGKKDFGQGKVDLSKLLKIMKS
ncbi:MAG: alanine--tRNA ligase [Candidatus Aenigmarchaeota archaeon]|nr:alanine--tRNA ligase [Candidatus Aenigmarchaeota archaeon]